MRSHTKTTTIVGRCAATRRSLLILSIFTAGILFDAIFIQNPRAVLLLSNSGQQQDDGENNNFFNSFVEIKDTHYGQQQQQDTTSYNNGNPNLEWCPKAKCDDDNDNGNGGATRTDEEKEENKYSSCQPCRDKYLFVIATGRSGSTTVMSMLNLLPGVRISGENADVFYQYHSMIETLRSSRYKPFQENKVGPWWHHKINASSFACPAQEFLRTINPPPPATTNNRKRKRNRKRKVKEDDEHAIITGFKEIRWFRDHDEFKDNSTQMVDAYRRLFPCSRFVFSVRSDIESQAKSAFWNKTKSTADKEVQNLMTEVDTLAYLKDLNVLHVQAYQYLGKDQAFWLDLNEWSAPGGMRKFDELADWLGFSSCKYPDEVGNCWDKKKFMECGEISIGDQCAYRYL